MADISQEGTARPRQQLDFEVNGLPFRKTKSLNPSYSFFRPFFLGSFNNFLRYNFSLNFSL